MLDGIKIISETSVPGSTMVDIVISLIMALFVGAVIISFVREICSKADSRTVRIVAIIFAVILVCMLVFGEWHIIHRRNDVHIEYEIEIDDSVGFNEFYEHYEIIDQDGDVYTVKMIKPVQPIGGYVQCKYMV